VLVLAPTRELAVQIGAAAQALAPQLRTVVAVGGLSINPQMMALRGGAHWLVATPGRLLDLTRQNALRLADLDSVVLDEADRLLDEGFADETRRVLALVPRPRQTLVFSATLPDPVRALVQAVQTDALAVQVAGQTRRAVPVAMAGEVPDERSAVSVASPPDIKQRAIVVDSARRTPLLRHLIAQHRWQRVLVFVATQHAAEQVADKLRHAGLPAAALHGDLSQGRRAQVLADLGSGQLQVLVATDLAARGLDVPAIDAVVNHDLARAAVDHTHRIGRTGRAGARGTAVSFVRADAPGSEAHFRLIEKRQQQRVPREVLPGYEPAAGALPAPVPADPNGGVKGRRPSKKDKLRTAAASPVK
jgi:superfamily II DNA/RNA helicase